MLGLKGIPIFQLCEAEFVAKVAVLGHYFDSGYFFILFFYFFYLFIFCVFRGFIYKFIIGVITFITCMFEDTSRMPFEHPCHANNLCLL